MIEVDWNGERFRLQEDGSLSPPTLAALESYLSNSGWAVVDRDGRTSLWRRSPRQGPPPSAENVQIVLPLAEGYTDYAERAYEALRALAYVEHRLPGEVASDMNRGGADTVAVRLTPDAPPGEAPLELAYAAVKALRNLVVASASALDIDSLVLPLRRPQRAEAFANQARLSTQPGSFILSLALPLTEPEATSPQQSDDDDALIRMSELPRPRPYGRLVTDRLLMATQYAQRLADQVISVSEAVRTFGEMRRYAPNATELAALADLGGADRSLYQLRVARSPLAAGEGGADMLSVTPGQQRIFAEASDFLRTKQPRDGVTVSGLVVRLFRVAKSGPGQVSIYGSDDDSGATRRFRVELTEDDYTKAITAHSRGLQVIAVGDIDARGTHLRLKHLTSFALVPTIDDED